MAGNGIVLFGHGARDPEWAGPMKRVAARIAERSPQTPVQVAFMEFLSPTLDEAVDTLVAAGCTELTVVPVFLAQGGHLKRDVPLLVETAAERHPQARLRLVTAAGEADGVVEAIADYALGLA
ncbi:sirohydrochlorin chelatase [Denitromonas iodatirespirans]|uniref:CbiX/SirB N-terminal domain-containing protein n=1 Tax=Denitromonas iodatirespirans TaxID=2795389 RepID=A0A944H824_DENI1|nr:CbiX/SirB N-terminal domain-containing protein [Denitromonas iodatirespirans]MBT0960925.1 CbiX/SirB N-terminal domain-containing protein [Denitromonas iodatirespirans]